MKKLVTTSLALALFLPLASAQTTWTGLGDGTSFADSGNWSNGTPNNSDNPGTINSGTPVITASVNSTTMTQGGGTTTVDSTNQIVMQNSSTWNLNGGTFDISNTGRFSLGSDSTMTVNGGSVTQTNSSTGDAFWINHATAVLNYLSGSFDLSGGAISHRLGTVLIDSSTMNVGTYKYAASSTEPILNLQNGGSIVSSGDFNYSASINTHQGEVNFVSGGSSIQAATWTKPDNFNFDFADAADGSFITIATGMFDEATWQDQWNNGYLTVNGGNIGSFSDYFSLTSTTLTFTAVPEPQTYALMAGFVTLLAVGIIRRRK